MDLFADDSRLLREALDRHLAGDPAARDRLLACTCERLTRLCRHVLKDYPGVKRWEQTDDVVQNVSLRLWKSLQEVAPPTVADFLRFTALQIRRELTDMARRYSGPEGFAAHHATGVQSMLATGLGPSEETFDPGQLAAWTEFHQAVERLPDDEREVFDLLWYQGLSQPDVAELLQLGERTVRRRWRSARIKVFETLTGETNSEFNECNSI